MENSWPFNSFLLVPTLLFTLLFCLNLFYHRKLNLPPGPSPWPIIGNLNLIGSLPHQSIHSLAKKYGPIMQLRFGSYTVVVGSSVEMARYFLKTYDHNFASRPKTAGGKYTTYNYSDMVWAPYGPYWRQARKMCQIELFSAKRLESFEYIRIEETKLFVNGLFKSCGKPIILKDHFSNLSLNVISRMVLGKKYTEKSESEIVTPKEFKEMLEELFLLNGVLDIGDSIPWVGFLDLQGYRKRMKAVMKKLDRFYEHVLDEHDGRGKNTSKDMVDVLLQLADDPSFQVKLQRHQIKALIQDLLGGGTESSMVTLEWAISEILKKPDIFKKATEELDRVVGRNRLVQEKDISNLPFIDAIVKETMRLHPVAPMLVPRVAREDCNVAGYDILKNTRVLVNVWSIGRDPAVWSRPDEFCPERFMENKEIDVMGHHFELLPFGAGRRMCPGYSLGLKVIRSNLANLLHGFAWKLPGDMKHEDLDMEEIFGLSTPRKFPLVAVPEPRLPLHVYSL
ncbi:trimethyltridecatetraene synthase-like [Pistacia vera]|uniref:trimethyltridecatetraene synthase-like n=1 Tax=Pistacia vera TaxID=55513 RepID=UPI001262FFCA|nr:trimethyltridecatetraene synthase-like [Pistacia vera]